MGSEMCIRDSSSARRCGPFDSQSLATPGNNNFISRCDRHTGLLLEHGGLSDCDRCDAHLLRAFGAIVLGSRPLEEIYVGYQHSVKNIRTNDDTVLALVWSWHLDHLFRRLFATR